MAQNEAKHGTPQQEAESQAAAKRGGSTNRGFASMDPERQRQIASQGGRAAHEKGTAHQFTPEEARLAGSKGGKAAHEKGTAHQFNSEEARIAGRKGGEASGAQRAKQKVGGPEPSQQSEAEQDEESTEH